MNRKRTTNRATRLFNILTLVTLLLLAGASLMYAAGTWTQKTPISGNQLSARRWHAMAYIGGDQALLFGGDDGTPDDETWVYDLSANTWTPQSPVGGTKPLARHSHAMAYLGGD